jgi:dTDP-4-dehydrorhamnose 3,5-epimerase
MKFIPTPLTGAFVIEPEPREDSRGAFARVFCRDEFTAQGLIADVAQCNLSFNPHKATLRGMHYQLAPHQEVKLVRCPQGAIFDVIIDLGSGISGRWFGVELTADNRRMLYVPKGFAHGYVTLTDNSEVFYQVSEAYHPQFERGVRWDDPAFNIRWPMKPMLLSDKDRDHPLWTK